MRAILERFTPVEFMLTQCARLLEDGRTAFIGFGMPQVAAMLAQRLHAPNLVFVYEFGAIGPAPRGPFVRSTMSSPANVYRSVAWTNMNTIFAQAQLGLIDYGVLGAAQVDRFGNVNSTMLGADYQRPEKRLPGAGGAPEVAAFCWRTIVVCLHERRRLVPRVDFVTTPGYLDGSPGARDRAGLPRDTGPWRLVTSKALFGFHPVTRELELIGVVEGATVDEVLDEMGMEPRVADTVEKLPPPSDEALRILRQEIDSGGTIIRSR